MGWTAAAVVGGAFIGSQMADSGGGGVSVPATPAPSATENAILEQILAQMTAPATAEQQAMTQYTMKLLENQIANLPIQQEYQQMAMDLMRQQVADQSSPEALAQKQVQGELAQWQLEGIKQVREMGAISGELSESELNSLNTIERNAINTLQTNVGIDARKVMSTVVSEMVDRGVLQGDVGAKAIADVQDRQNELLTQGISSIESTRMAQQLGLQSDKASRDLAWRQALMSGAITTGQYQQGVQADLGRTLSGISSSAQNLESQALQYGSGLSQQYTLGKLNAGISQWGQMASMRGNEANRALEAAIASAEANASSKASTYGAFGSLLGAGAGAYGTYAGLAAMSSKRYKKDIIYLGFDLVKGVKAVLFRYIDRLNIPGWKLGAIAEEVVKVRPDAVILDSEGMPDAINYMQLFQGV